MDYNPRNVFALMLTVWSSLFYQQIAWFVKRLNLHRFHINQYCIPGTVWYVVCNLCDVIALHRTANGRASTLQNDMLSCWLTNTWNSRILSAMHVFVMWLPYCHIFQSTHSKSKIEPLQEYFYDFKEIYHTLLKEQFCHTLFKGQFWQQFNVIQWVDPGAEFCIIKPKQTNLIYTHAKALNIS